jgi:transcriptional activator SPT7
MMNANITTQRRMRRTHAKFVALGATSATANNAGAGDDADGADLPTAGVAAGLGGDADGSEDAEVVAVDERPWPVPRPTRKAALQEGFVDPSPDIGEMAAEKCMQWVNRKILEHIGFQGSSQLAVDALSGITVEYLANVGRTFRFYLDKYSNTMTSEEIILHSLFESGVSRIQNLERYITDDIVRHGNRLNDLEKKIVNVYQEFTSAEAIDDDTLFANEDDEEEESAFVMGQFTDDIGEDFLGLRELGIANEFGLSSLSIPKRLLKGKKNAKPNATAKSAEPPPPYPPPPSFVQLTAESVKNQIGLLRDYYERRLANPNPNGMMTAPAVLTDDPPNPIQTKLGPLGQVMRPTSAAIAAAASGSKKKSKAVAAMVQQPATPVLSPRLAPPPPPPPPTVSVVLAAPSMPPMPTIAQSAGIGVTEQQQQVTPKKKGATPVANGASAPGSAGGGKKRGRPPEGLPPIVVASA